MPTTGHYITLIRCEPMNITLDKGGGGEGLMGEVNRWVKERVRNVWIGMDAGGMEMG